jgi:hypothetical protein
MGASGEFTLTIYHPRCWEGYSRFGTSEIWSRIRIRIAVAVAISVGGIEGEWTTRILGVWWGIQSSKVGYTI